MDLPQVEARAESVAIVGAGPAGLSAPTTWPAGHQEHHLRGPARGRRHAAVGVPAYRLPPPSCEYEIDNIRGHGRGDTLNTPHRQGPDPDAPQEPGLPGRLPGRGRPPEPEPAGARRGQQPACWPGVEFLRGVALEAGAQRPGVVVVGGGNVAIDAARTALRLGAAKVTMVTAAPGREAGQSLGDRGGPGRGRALRAPLAAPKDIKGGPDGQVGAWCSRRSLGSSTTTGASRPGTTRPAPRSSAPTASSRPSASAPTLVPGR